jgi:hypothetical protein
MESQILPNPPGPGFLRVCRNCHRPFALKLEAARPDDKSGTLRVYRCKFCGAEATHAARHPRDAV